MPVDFDVFTSLMDGYMHLHVGCMIGMWNLGDPMQAVRCTCTIHIALALVDKVLETCIYRIVFLLILVACSVKINLHICAVQYIVKYVKLTVHLCCLNNFH